MYNESDSQNTATPRTRTFVVLDSPYYLWVNGIDFVSANELERMYHGERPIPQIISVPPLGFFFYDSLQTIIDNEPKAEVQGRQCSLCCGAGRSNGRKCHNCKGKGYITKGKGNGSKRTKAR